MQVAVAEAKNLVEQGHRVAFFAPSNGELERLADVLREYSVPFQLALVDLRPHRRIWRSAPISLGGCEHLPGEGPCPPRRGVS